MIHATGKVPSPLPKSLNRSTGKYSTQATGFNDASSGENTHSLVKLITHKLWPESYDQIVEGTRAFAKKTCGVIQSDEVIDLTADKPLTEFVMIVDLPTDDEGDDKGGNVSDNRNLSNDGNAGDDGNEVSDGEEDEDGNDRGGSENKDKDKDKDMMEGEYEEEDVAIYVDNEDEWVDERHPKGLWAQKHVIHHWA